jgi:hypothetical protein
MSKRFVVLLGVLGLFLGTAHRASADIVGKDDRRPVAELEANDPLRSLSKPFGVLLYTVKNRDGKIDVWEGCTAAVISQTHVLTVPWCAGGIEIPTTARAAIRGFGVRMMGGFSSASRSDLGWNKRLAARRRSN